MHEGLPTAQHGLQRRGQADDASVQHLNLHCSTQAAGRRPDGPRTAWSAQSQPKGLPCLSCGCQILKCIKVDISVPVSCGSSLFRIVCGPFGGSLLNRSRRYIVLRHITCAVVALLADLQTFLTCTGCHQIGSLSWSDAVAQKFAMPSVLIHAARATVRRTRRGLYAGKTVRSGNNVSEDGGNRQECTLYPSYYAFTYALASSRPAA